MGFTVYYSNPEITSKAGFGRVARLPCIFDSTPRYHRLASAYLIDRGLGLWNPVSHGSDSRRDLLTDQTIKTYADWLTNFLEWASVRGIDLTTCTYADHVHGRYQEEMAKGIWSRDGEGLAPKTINSRVQQACDYLTWLCDKGIRPYFHIPTHTVTVYRGSAFSSIGHKGMQVESRKGKVRTNVKKLRMPTEEDVENWLEAVYRKVGYSRGLMCEFVVHSALRRAEVVSLRIDTLGEDPATWHLNDPSAPRSNQRVRLDIRYGAKGHSYGYDHGDKIGPERIIWIPLDLAERIHVYRQRIRNTALKKWVKSAPTTAQQRERISNAVHLFLDEDTGERITYKELYRSWTAVNLPFKGWSPHLGRHYWSCVTILKRVEENVEIQNLIAQGKEVPQNLVESIAESTIRLTVQPQLGHADKETTIIYVDWIVSRFGSNISIEIDRGDEEALNSLEESRSNG